MAIILLYFHFVDLRLCHYSTGFVWNFYTLIVVFCSLLLSYATNLTHFLNFIEVYFRMLSLCLEIYIFGKFPYFNGKCVGKVLLRSESGKSTILNRKISNLNQKFFDMPHVDPTYALISHRNYSQHKKKITHLNQTNCFERFCCCHRFLFLMYNLKFLWLPPYTK